jgi:CelD/BcsL family acetyltransferase involved in cellulose biosynthesis
LFSVDVIDDVKRFKALREDWNRLALKEGTVFQTWEWSWHWWQANKRGKRLLIIALYKDDKLVGLAPLYMALSYYGLPIKVVSILGTNGTDYLDFLITDSSPEILAKIIDVIQDDKRWDALDIHQIADGNMLSDELLKRAAAERTLSEDKVKQDICYRLELPDSYDLLLKRVSKKFRWNVQYYSRRIARDHDLKFRLSDSSTVEKDMDTFFALHKKRFLDLKKPGAYLSPSFRRMHNSIAGDLSEKGQLRLYIMEIDKKPVAALYGFSFNNSFYYYLGGFEPEWGRMSVSTVLIAYAIEQAIAEGLAYFDFLRGDEPYKKKWMSCEATNYRVLISRSGKRSQVVKKMLALENELAKKAKDIVQNIR